jgi:restriction endonuclease S subunit
VHLERQELTANMFKNIEIELPPLIPNCKIARNLVQHDDLKEITKRIKLLEEKAQLTYEGMVYAFPRS